MFRRRGNRFLEKNGRFELQQWQQHTIDSIPLCNDPEGIKFFLCDHLLPCSITLFNTIGIGKTTNPRRVRRTTYGSDSNTQELQYIGMKPSDVAAANHADL